mgnify:CR=1 FL=1
MSTNHLLSDFFGHLKMMFSYLTLQNIVLHWKMLVEISILWIVYYRVFIFLKGTKAVHLVRGIVVLALVFFLAQKLGLNTVTWLMTQIFAISVFGVFVLFQPELRQGLSRLGQKPLLHSYRDSEIDAVVKKLVKASGVLSKKKIGALMAVQREMGLKNYVESGTVINAQLSTELIEAIFYPSAPLHDGGIIISLEGVVLSAGCLFPLTDSPYIDKGLGMRHRAAVGLSEDSDAVIIVISEETGSISLAINGKLTRDLSLDDLFTILKGLLKKKRV